MCAGNEKTLQMQGKHLLLVFRRDKGNLKPHTKSFSDALKCTDRRIGVALLQTADIRLCDACFCRKIFLSQMAFSASLSYDLSETIGDIVLRWIIGHDSTS